VDEEEIEEALGGLRNKTLHPLKTKNFEAGRRGGGNATFWWEGRRSRSAVLDRCSRKKEEGCNLRQVVTGSMFAQTSLHEIVAEGCQKLASIGPINP